MRNLEVVEPKWLVSKLCLPMKETLDLLADSQILYQFNYHKKSESAIIINLTKYD